MMLQCRNNDHIAGLHKLFSVTMCYKIDAFRSAFCKDHFIVMSRIYKISYFFPGSFKCIRCLLAQMMHTAMYIAVEMCIIIFNCFDNLHGF